MKSWRKISGFSLIEMMIVIAVIGVLLGVGVPAYQNYIFKAKVTEGFSMFMGMKPAIADFYTANGRLPSNFTELGLTVQGKIKTVHSGPSAKFEDIFGYKSDLWKTVELQPKVSGKYRILVFRADKKKTPDGSDIGLHLMMKGESSGIVKFKCTVNGDKKRKQYVPVECMDGSVNDWRF